MVSGINLDAIDDDFALEWANWALETGIWNGRLVTRKDAGAFQAEVEQRILATLFSNDPASVGFQQLASVYASAGADPANRSLLDKEIEELRASSHCGVLLVKRGTLSKFWKKHKKEILIGVVVAAIVTTVVVVAVCSGGTAAGAATAAGGALLDGITNGDKERPTYATSGPIPWSTVPQSKATATAEPNPLQQVFDLLQKPKAPGETLFLERGIMMNGQFVTYQEMRERGRQEELLACLNNRPALLPQTPQVIESAAIAAATMVPTPASSSRSFLYEFFETVGRKVMDLDPPPAQVEFPAPRSPLVKLFETIGRDTLDLDPLDPSLQGSRDVKISGVQHPRCRIGGINGMNTPVELANSHAGYLASFTPNQSVNWVYNSSNGPFTDLAEIFLLNFLGFSPKTSNLLKEDWLAFHEENKDNPQLKYLQFCHSQGAIHVKNTLESLPEEIRQRIIVVAIAPAVVVPEELCYRSHNYASKRDGVNYGELVLATALDTNEYSTSKFVELTLEHRKQLILLDPHPDATDIDHEFQSPTFFSKIEQIIKEHTRRNGEYK